MEMATTTIESAITGSTKRGGRVSTPVAASDSVMLCARVNAVTIFRICRSPPPNSNRLSRKRM